MYTQPKTPKRRFNFRRANRAMPHRRMGLSPKDVDFKNTDLLKKYVTENGKILSRRTTGVAAHLHRKITRAIKQARAALLMK
jgi:small subunit ribosomal protein S18